MERKPSPRLCFRFSNISKLMRKNKKHIFPSFHSRRQTLLGRPTEAHLAQDPSAIAQFESHLALFFGPSVSSVMSSQSEYGPASKKQEEKSQGITDGTHQQGTKHCKQYRSDISEEVGKKKKCSAVCSTIDLPNSYGQWNLEWDSTSGFFRSFHLLFVFQRKIKLFKSCNTKKRLNVAEGWQVVFFFSVLYICTLIL